MTEMIPTLLMAILYLLAGAGIYYFLKNRNEEYPFDLIIGFFTVSLLFVLSYQWYIGWQDYYNGTYLTITSFYMAGFTGFVAIIMAFLEVAFAYQYVFYESRDVTV